VDRATRARNGKRRRQKPVPSLKASCEPTRRHACNSLCTMALK
jgi:hypothetical protein